MRCVSPPLEDVCLCVCITSLRQCQTWLVPVITFADLQCSPGLLLQHQLMLCEEVAEIKGKYRPKPLWNRDRIRGDDGPFAPSPPLSPSCISDNHPLRDEEAEEAACSPMSPPSLPHQETNSIKILSSVFNTVLEYYSLDGRY